MHVSYVHEGLRQNFEIHGPCIGGSGLRVGLIWPYSNHVFDLEKSSSPHQTKCMVDIHLTLYQNCEIHDPWIRASGSRGGGGNMAK